MGRSRSFKTNKEFTREQELSHKNKELQREIARLRKSLDKLKYGWCPKCMGDSEESLNRKSEKLSDNKKIKDRTCYQCGKASLIMIKYPRYDGDGYRRECPSCGYRTRGKKLTEDVKE